jgi:hypothetical protein
MTLESVPSSKGLSDAELCIVAEVAIEVARAAIEPLNAHATALTFARAALKDADLKRALAATHRIILTKRAVDPHRMLAPIGPLFQELQQRAERVLGPNWASN